jgi:hypothetical protein
MTFQIQPEKFSTLINFINCISLSLTLKKKPSRLCWTIKADSHIPSHSHAVLLRL